jgi:hypothetical protein
MTVLPNAVFAFENSHPLHGKQFFIEKKETQN